MKFRQLDIRVGVIKEVEPHPNADKLYVLTVDIGEERRIVAGLKPYYTPSQLRGKKILVVANMQRKKIRGITSEGMLLAADDGKDVGVLTPLGDVKEGTPLT